MDADSEGEEGSFYVWTEDELDKALGKDAEIIKKYYQTSKEGNWEKGLNILHTKQSLKDFSFANKLEIDGLTAIVLHAKSRLLNHRKKRIRPGLDDKVLTGWNALTLKGLIDAYHAFGEASFLDLAEKNASFIHEILFKKGALVRSFFKDANVINGYLDDYATSIDAFYSLYQATFNRQWLELAVELTDYTIEHIYDPAEELFFYTDDKSEQLIARKKEVFDNVIPASNSVMAQNLYLLGIILERKQYLDISESMLSKIVPMLKVDPQYLTNWGTLYAFRTQATAEIAIVGEEYLSFSHGVQRLFLPNKVISADGRSNDLPLLKDRTAINGKTTICVCFNKSCKLPVHSVNEALQQMQERN